MRRLRRSAHARGIVVRDNMYPGHQVRILKLSPHRKDSCEEYLDIEMDGVAKAYSLVE